jgi:hypothetical protein
MALDLYELRHPLRNVPETWFTLFALPTAPPTDGSDRWEHHHRCERKNCVNGAHVVLVTRKEHAQIHKELRAAKRAAMKPAKKPKKSRVNVFAKSGTVVA